MRFSGLLYHTATVQKWIHSPPRWNLDIASWNAKKCVCRYAKYWHSSFCTKKTSLVIPPFDVFFVVGNEMGNNSILHKSLSVTMLFFIINLFLDPKSDMSATVTWSLAYIFLALPKIDTYIYNKKCTSNRKYQKHIITINKTCYAILIYKIYLHAILMNFYFRYCW